MIAFPILNVLADAGQPVMIAGGFLTSGGNDAGIFQFEGDSLSSQPTFADQQDTLASVFPPHVDLYQISEGYPRELTFLTAEVGELVPTVEPTILVEGVPVEASPEVEVASNIAERESVVEPEPARESESVAEDQEDLFYWQLPIPFRIWQSEPQFRPLLMLESEGYSRWAACQHSSVSDRADSICTA